MGNMIADRVLNMAALYGIGASTGLSVSPAGTFALSTWRNQLDFDANGNASTDFTMNGSSAQVNGELILTTGSTRGRGGITVYSTGTNVVMIDGSGVAGGSGDRLNSFAGGGPSTFTVRGGNQDATGFNHVSAASYTVSGAGYSLLVSTQPGQGAGFRVVGSSVDVMGSSIVARVGDNQTPALFVSQSSAQVSGGLYSDTFKIGKYHMSFSSAPKSGGGPLYIQNGIAFIGSDSDGGAAAAGAAGVSSFTATLDVMSARLSSGTPGGLGAVIDSSATWTLSFSSNITQAASWQLPLINYRATGINLRGSFYVQRAVTGNVKIVARVWKMNANAQGPVTSYDVDNSTTLVVHNVAGLLHDFTLPLTNKDSVSTDGDRIAIALEIDPAVGSIAQDTVRFTHLYLKEE
jgi:hypothetical protein